MSGAALYDALQIAYEFVEQAEQLAGGGDYDAAQASLEKAKSYTDELGISEDMLFLLDRSDSFYKSIGGFSMPETIFVNGDGEIVVHKRGPMELDEMREHVNKILQ